MLYKRTTMDFFAEQISAHQRTAVLAVGFCVAMSAVVVALYGVGMAYWFVIHRIADSYLDFAVNRHLPAFRWWDPRVFKWTAVGTAAFVGGASLVMMFRLRRPIDYIMFLLDAVEVSADPRVPHLQQYCNVVGEMAIAAQIPTPRVFVMSGERAINGLTVGWSKENAAIAITNGALNMLNRDELQGVVAHEVSHILNGDMRMNVRMTGVLYGIDAIGIIGHVIFNTLIASAQPGVRGMDNVVALFSWVALILALPLLIVSGVGVLFGSLIRAAISRQREYLADASAVQFTRYPDGIGGALRKMGGLVFGSCIMAAQSSTAGHFFLADSSGRSLMNSFAFATHPPLARRIRRIDPLFNGEFEYVPSYYRSEMGKVESLDWLHARSRGAVAVGAAAAAAGSAIRPGRPDPDRILSCIALPKYEEKAWLEGLFAAMPQELASASETPSGSRGIIYALLVSGDEAVARGQLQYVAGHASAATHAATVRLLPQVRAVSPESRIPLLDRALGSAVSSDVEAAVLLQKTADELALADRQVDLFEYVASIIIGRATEHAGRRARLAAERAVLMQATLAEACLVLSCVARWGGGDEKSLAAAYEKGWSVLDFAEQTPVLPDGVCDLFTFDAALDHLSLARPFTRQQMLAACVVTAMSDGELTVLQSQVLRGIAEKLNYALPVLKPGPVRSPLC